MSKKLNREDFTTKSVIGSVDYAKVKRALTGQNLQELCQIYELFIRFDTQISSEIKTRRQKIAALPFLLKCENEKQSEFLLDYLNSGDFRLFLFDMTSAIAYGFSVFIKEWVNDNGKILPKYKFIEHSFFENDKTRLVFKKTGEKYYLDETGNTFTYLHPSDTGDFINSSLMYKIVCIAALKMLAINQNMNYFENLAVPPVILNMENYNPDNDEEINNAIDMLLSLRSNSVGVFGKDDVVSLLTGNTDKDSFLNFIRYCDESISKVITGEVLSSNAVQKGTQALGLVHAEQKKVTTEFDALILAGGVKVVVKNILALNFGEIAPFDFAFDTNTETEEEKQISVFKGLYDIGVQVPLEHLEKTFKIDGLTRRNTDGVAPTAEPTTTTAEPTTARHSERSEESQSQIQKSKTEPKFADDIDKSIAKKSLKGELKDIERFLNSVLKDCDTYEEAYKRICENSGEFEFEALEEALANAFTNAVLKSKVN